MFDPDVLDPVVDSLAQFSGDGQALELAFGTGRVALPLFDHGIPVSGIEGVSSRWSTRCRTALGNLRTQAEPFACFSNAAAHLAPGVGSYRAVGAGDRALPTGPAGRPLPRR